MSSSIERKNNQTSEETERGSLLRAIDTAIIAAQKALIKNAGEKGSLADLIRLMQLRRELEGDQPRQITVRWIDDECRTSND